MGLQTAASMGWRLRLHVTDRGGAVVGGAVVGGMVVRLIVAPCGRDLVLAGLLEQGLGLLLLAPPSADGIPVPTVPRRTATELRGRP